MNNNDHALNQFILIIAELQTEVNTLSESVSNHLDFNPDNINWGHVGTAQHLLELVQEINEFNI